MSTIIRRVPENWEHPKTIKIDYRNGGVKEDFKSLSNDSYEEDVKQYEQDLKEYLENCELWKQGKNKRRWGQNEVVSVKSILEGVLTDIRNDRENHGFDDTYRQDEELKILKGYYTHADYAGEPPMYPNPENYMPETGPWYQLYQTVSEGSPLTPPFPTLEELGNWLENNKDYWDRTWSKEAVKDLLENEGFTMSGIISDGKLYGATEQYKLNSNEPNK